jgi:hypothetical protein
MRKKMGSESIVSVIRYYFIQSIPFLRAGWTMGIFIGIGLIVLAFILKRNPERKKSPSVLGILGMLAFISSGVQLVYSWFLI